MTGKEKTRREVLKATSAAVAGATLTGCAATKTGSKIEPVDTSRILNYNPKMGYRRLGKTDIMVSEISLGGHGYGQQQNREENRFQVLERAAELGMNYLDTNIAGECDLYGRALRGKRDKWHIGFASWPQKVTTEYEDQLSKEGMIKSIEDRLKGYKTDMLDMWRPVGATWDKDPTKTTQKHIPTMLMVSCKTLDMVVEVFEKVQKQGKVRWLGISAHNPKVFRRVLNEYPQFSVILFPYLFLTKPLGGDSLLALAKQKGVGVIGIKPFGAGTVFNIKPREITDKLDQKAASLLKNMLQE
ncbi:MAG: aldo/keto reductase, partial [Planctomycetota bacterium]